MSKLSNCSGFRFLLFTLVIAAVAFRLAFFIFGLRHLPISTDEAWPALMGRHVLKGEFPVFYWGQNYMGSHQAFFDAFVFILLGVNTFAARIYPLFFSFLYVAATCLLAHRLYGRETAITTLALLIAPVPYLTMAGTLSVPPEYLPLTALGSCALFLLAGIVLKNSAKITLNEMPSFLLLGLLLGLMFWLHLVAISYIAVAVLFIFLRDKLFIFRPAFWLCVLCFFIGGFPFWRFNFTHDFITFADVSGTGHWQSAMELLKALFSVTLHFMTGMKVMLYGDSCHFVSLPTPLAWLLDTVWCGVIALVIMTRFRGMLRWLTWKPKDADGTAILLALATVILYFFCRSERSAWHSARFILPVMSALPILLACGLEQVRQWNRYVFVFLLIIIIGAQARGNFLLCREWNDPEVVAKKLELPDTAGLRQFLREHGIRHAYAHYWISYRITFESREEIICAEPFNERFPGRPAQYLNEVHIATNIAFITHPTLQFVPNFEKHLLALGAAYRKEQKDDFTVYYDIVPPYGNIKLREIKRDGFQISSNYHPELLARLLDGDQKTEWSTGEPQKAGNSLLIDIGRVEEICKIYFDLSGLECDAPNGYRLEVSGDGEEWEKVYEYGPVTEGFFWENNQLWMFVGNSFYSAAFTPVAARYIRMTLTESHHRYWWSITEVQIFGPEEIKI